MDINNITRDLDLHDDYWIHQQKTSIIQVEESDPGWFERCYGSVHDPNGEVLINWGMGCQMNLGNMDAFTSVVRGTTQRNIRAYRKVHNDRAVMHVGPFQFDIIEPMNRWRLQLKENEYGVSFDLEFKKHGTVFQYKPIIQERVQGGPPMVWIHFVQLPEYNGTLTVNGKTYDVKKWGYFRDRSWGTRQLDLYGTYWLHYVAFRDYCIYLTHLENIDNSLLFSHGVVEYYETGKKVEIVMARHNFEFDPGTYRVKSARFELDCEDGTVIPLSAKRLHQGPLCHGGGYPAGNIPLRHGAEYGGDYHIECEEYDVNEPRFLTMGADVYDMQVEYDNGEEKTDGLLEFGILNANTKYKATLK